MARWACAALAVMALGLSGCAGRPDGNLLPIGDVTIPGASTVDMLVATDRSSANALPGQMFTGERGPMAFADISVSIPPDAVRKVGEIQWPDKPPGDPARNFVTLRADKIDLATARKRFDGRIASKGGHVLLFVHGFNTKFEEAVYRLAQIVHDSDATVLPVLFTWPSRGKLFAYTYDRESANYSRDALEGVLQALAHDPAVKDVSILAHSMGNWVTVEALRQMAIRDKRIAPKIKTVMLAAPDLDIDVFQKQIKDIGENRPPFVLFTSRNDIALEVSQRVWGSAARLGNIDPNTEPYKTDLARDHILAIDLSNVKSADRLGHGTFAESPDIVRLIGTRLASGQTLNDSRLGLGDKLGQVAIGAAATVGQAASVAISAPISIVDPTTRENFGGQVEQFGASAADTVTLGGQLPRR